MLFGLIIIVVGLVLLLKNLDILTASSWNIIYPAVIVLIGLAIMLKKKKCRGNSINQDE
jgi:uncharacterized membrane protein